MNSTTDDGESQHTVLNNGYPSDWDDVGGLWDMDGHEPYTPSLPPTPPETPKLVAVPKDAKRKGGAAPWDVREALAKDDKGNLIRSQANLDKIFQLDSYFGSLAWSEFTKRIVFNGEPVKDSVTQHFRVHISQGYGLEYSIADCFEASRKAAEGRTRNELKEYVESLKWDGVGRIETGLLNLCGVKFDAYSKSVSRVFFLSAAARALRPGCKVDTMLILVGSQGAGKSSLVRELFCGFSSDTALDVRQKDSLIALQGKWCVEIAELTALRGKESEPVKAFLTSQTDTYRKPYGRFEESAPRTCVFVGTTNTEDFLTDETGARRFMPVRVGEMNLAAAIQEREQLWAEAAHRVKAGEPWWFSKEEAAVAAGVALEHIERDVWHDVVGEYLAEVERATEVQVDGPGVSIDEVLKHLGVLSAFADRRHDKRVALCLKAHGYETRKVRVGQGTRRRWVKV